MFKIFNDPDKRAVLSWLGGGIAIVAGGMWTVLTFFVEHKETEKKSNAPAISIVSQGIVSGGDTRIGGNLIIGPTAEEIAKIQRPLTDQLDQKDSQISALMKLLDGKVLNASALTRQGVDTAVRSIVDGAAAGDPGLQQALHLLEADKIADASEVLRVDAEMKSKSSDKKAALDAYRNLAFITELVNPNEAANYYLKALNFDPSDAQSLLYLAEYQIIRGDLDAAKDNLQKLISDKSVKDDALRQSALLSLGNILAMRGDDDGAEALFLKAQSIASEQLAADPGSSAWQHTLLLSAGQIGDFQMWKGNLTKALICYLNRINLAKRLLASSPSSDEYKSDLAVSYVKMGDLQQKIGNVDELLSYYQSALSIYEALRNKSPIVFYGASMFLG